MSAEDRDMARSILNAYNPGERLRRDDETFIRGLLSRHPDAAIKVGAGVDHITVEVNSRFRTRCFWITRVDGSRTDFSYLQCVKELPHEQKVRKAMRRAVEEFTMSFKREMTPCRCPHTGRGLTFTDCHVHHCGPTFKQLSSAFMKAKGLDWSGIELHDTSDGMEGCEFADKRLEAEWQEYHNSRAKLQAVSREANLGILNMGKRK